MPKKAEVQHLLDLIIEGRGDLIYDFLRKVGSQGDSGELDFWHFVTWRIRSLLIASQFRLDLKSHQLRALRARADCLDASITLALGKAVPAPGLAWTCTVDGPELNSLRERVARFTETRGRNRRSPADNRIGKVCHLTWRVWEWLHSSSVAADGTVALEILRSTAMEVLEEEMSDLSCNPVTESTLRDMLVRDLERLSFKLFP